MSTLRTTIITGTLLCMISMPGQAQRGREVMLTHFMGNTQAINPGYVGGREAFTITSLNRSQWTMLFEKPPSFQSFSFHTPTEDHPMGLGLAVHTERVGPERNTSVEGDVAYQVKTSRRSTLSFGIKAGINMFTVPLTQLIIDDPSDPLFASDIESHWLPNFGFGMYYRRDNLYVGVSIPKLLMTNPFTNKLYAGAKPALTERNYYFIAGAALPLNIDMDFVPTAVLKARYGGELEVGVSASIVFFDKFSGGMIYKHNDAIGIIAGLRVHNHWTVSYSFDWGIKNRSTHWNSGTHEIMLRYDLVFLYSHRENAKRPF